MPPVLGTARTLQVEWNVEGPHIFAERYPRLGGECEALHDTYAGSLGPGRSEQKTEYAGAAQCAVVI